MDWDRQLCPHLFDGLEYTDFLEALSYIEQAKHLPERLKTERINGLKLTHLIMGCFRFEGIKTYDEVECALKAAEEIVENRATIELPNLLELDWSGMTREDYVLALSPIKEEPVLGEDREMRWSLQMAQDAMYLFVRHTLGPAPRSFSTMGMMDEVAARFYDMKKVLETRIEVSRIVTERGVH